MKEKPERAIASLTLRELSDTSPQTRGLLTEEI